MTEYDAMNLDQLLELSRSDAEHAGDMAEQARVLREMAGDLTDNVDLMRGVMATLFDPDDAENAPWSGESAKMMKTELDRLFKPASSAPEVLETNAKAMDDFGSKVHATLVEIDQLHVKSEGGKNKADVDKARQVMQEANSGYVTAADQMPEPEFYNGLRKSAEDEPGPWTDQHGATPTGDVEPFAYGQPTQPGTDPGSPDDGRPGSDGQPTRPVQPTQPGHTIPVDSDTGGEPQLQGPAPTAPPVAPNPGAPPVNPGPNPWVPPTNPGPNPWVPPVNPGPIGGPRPTQPIVTKPGANPWLPNPRPTTPTIIGPTRPTVMPPRLPGPVTPNPNGTVPPVIGTRPGTPIAPIAPRPQGSGPGGTVRPVIGGRPGMPLPPMGNRPHPSNPGGTGRPTIGGRPGPGAVPFGTRPSALGTGTGVPPVRPAGGTVSPLGGVRSGARGNNRSHPTPPRTGGPGTSSLVPRSVVNARPAGGLAFGGTGRPPVRPVTTKATGLPGSRAGTAKPEAKPVGKIPGQRVKRTPRQGGKAVEGAIKRGFQRKPQSRAPGQEVFAKFDAAAKANEEAATKQSKHETDPDSEWAIRTVSVPAVITTRKAK